MDHQCLELYRRIQAFDLDAADAKWPFSLRLARENCWDEGFTRRVIEEYRKFAFLAMAAGHPVTPSDQVDQAWHICTSPILGLIGRSSAPGYWASPCIMSRAGAGRRSGSNSTTGTARPWRAMSGYSDRRRLPTSGPSLKYDSGGIRISSE